jgi:hypothetical protein
MTRETPALDEEIFVNDVNYGIADCRKRLRSRRSTLRAQQDPPKNKLAEQSPQQAAERVKERGEALIT